jgi:hypothetical protein
MPHRFSRGRLLFKLFDLDHLTGEVRARDRVPAQG